MNKIIGGSHHEHAELQRDTVRKDTVVDVINSTTGDRNFDREFLARNLHDNLGGLLSMVKLNLKNIKSFSAMDEPDIVCFNTAMDILNKSIDELRNMTHHTMPDSLMVYGLKTAIESFCSTVPTAHFRYDIEAYSRDSKVEMIIYQCFYELMNNAMKHASAQNIDVLLKVNDASVSLTVCDDGIGFDMETDAYGAGFENIRNRLTACNGKLNIRSTPGVGSEIDIEIKLIN